MLSKSPTPINPRNVLSSPLAVGRLDLDRPAAIDPITLVINECMVILLAMRKMSRWSQNGVAAILGAGDIFADDDHLASLALPGPQNARNGSTVPTNPLHSGFLQLRSILIETTDIYSVDSLTLIQPFLLAIELGSTSGAVTVMALNAVTKFLDYDIIGLRSKNIKNLLAQIIYSLTSCQFEAADQSLDDAVLLKVLRLLELIVDSPLSSLLTNSVVSVVIEICLSLACNKRRSEVLRRAAEMAMVSMTIRVFRRLRELEPEATPNEDIPNYTNLPADVVGSTQHDEESGATVGLNLMLPRKTATADTLEAQFDIVCINEFFGTLISKISPSNQYQHMESTRVFALSLINTAIEVAGDEFPNHASLMGMVADPVSKDVLQIITTTDSPALLLAALRLFCTMSIVLGRQLKSQTELAFNLLFRAILPPASQPDNAIKGNRTAVSTRMASSKEAIVESISLLWTRSPQFFSQFFVEFDCDFERSDMATSLVQFLCKLALPESAFIATDNVPPICLEGILSLIAGINDRIKSSTTETLIALHPLILDKEQKTSFVKCTDIFNDNPKKGVAALADKKFISNINDVHELAQFFFHKSTRLNKKVLGEYLAKPSNVELLKEFMGLFEFSDLRVDEALRLLLKAFRLPGESQQIERVVELFADAYVKCQDIDAEKVEIKEADKTESPESNKPQAAESGDEEKTPVRPDRDTVFILSYSIIMLNTDLHNPQVKQQMDLEAYRRNLKGVYGGKDFPEWYLAKIYSSIRDREIIMPEEHHGTEKWFDDVWHNLISSQSKYAQDHGVSFADFDLATLCQFDKLLFGTIVDEIIDTLIKVFKEASDDNIITKLMSSIDKCASICIHYDLTDSVDKLIKHLTELSTLTDKKHQTMVPDENVRKEIPITQISIEKKDEAITISEMAVNFGRDFKAQLSTVVLFRLIKKPACKVTDSWGAVMKIILTLFENCLINPNLFREFQKKLRLQPLANVKPRYIIKRMKPLKDSGLLSTFSSFLKGYSDEPPEPTDQEVESTLSTIDCVRSVNVPGIFDTVSKGSNEELKTFIDIILESLPVYSEDKKRYFETEVLFLFEVEVCFSLIVNNPEVTNKIIAKLVEYLKSDVTKRGYIRLSTYLFLLARQSDATHKDVVRASIDRLLTFDKDLLLKHGASLILTLFSLVDDESSLKSLVHEEPYWNILRNFASIPEFAGEIMTFVESIVKNSPEEINEVNYVPLLGLLDEVSSLGAVGAQWEQAKEQGDKGQNGAETPVNENVMMLVELSKRSVNLTGELGIAQQRLSYPLIQALAHQCFNPCRDVRSHAVKVLQTALLSSMLSDDFTAPGIYEYGLFPLLAELEKDDVINTDTNGFSATHLEILNMVSKVFLQYHSQFSEEEREKVWLGIVDNFVSLNLLNAQLQKNVVKESSLEVMKNMILVLQNEFLTSDNSKLWDATWENLNQVYPGLKDELVSK